MPLSEKFQEALVFATELHADQVRKGMTIPYASHLLIVAGYVLDHGGTEEEAIAALLHDAVEDQGGLDRPGGHLPGAGRRAAGRGAGPGGHGAGGGRPERGLEPRLRRTLPRATMVLMHPSPWTARRPSLWLAGLLLLLAACGGGDASEGARALGPHDGRELPPADTGRVAVGDVAPDFTLASLAHGEITLSDYRGRREIVLVFYRGRW